MDNTTLGLYHTFSVVARCESISDAAKELFISQPAVSKSIKKLEEELNTILLNRNSRGITLTSEGAMLYEYIKNAFETISAGEENIKHINQFGIGHIKIGVSSTLCKHVLLPYLKDYLSLHPHTQITIECQSTIQTVKLLETKDIDIGIIVQPGNNKKFTCIPITELEDTFVANPIYINNLLEREHIGKDKILSKSNLILLDKKNVTRRYLDYYLSRWNIDTDNAMELNSMELLIDFAKTGIGVAGVIKQFVTSELDSGLLLEIPQPSAIKKREVCFAYPSSVTPTGAVKTFIDYIENKIS